MIFWSSFAPRYITLKELDYSLRRMGKHLERSLAGLVFSSISELLESVTNASVSAILLDPVQYSHLSHRSSIAVVGLSAEYSCEAHVVTWSRQAS